MIQGYFGLPGSGKTTLLTRIAQKALKKGHYSHILTNFYCKGCEQINFADLGHYNLENCLILLDEITLDADNRQFKSFPKEALQFFVLHRHYNTDVVYATQNWENVDKKIRDLTHSLYYMRAVGGNFPLIKKLIPITKASTIYRTLDIDEMTHDIVSGYRFPNLFEKIVGRVSFLVFRPAWYKYFDTCEKPFELPEYSYKPW